MFPLSGLRSLAAFVCAAAVLGGQTGAPAPPDRHDTIIVTGTPEPLPLEESDRAVMSLPVRSQALLFTTFIDFLRLDPSLDLRQRAPNGLQADLSIRGATFGQTLVLLNGRRMNDPQSGHHHLDLPVPLESVEQIEILRGAGSTLYGSDATGGVVHLVTRPPEASEIRVQAGYGSWGTQQQRVSLTGVRGGLSQQLAVSRDFSTGFIQNRDYRNLMAASTTRYRSWLGASSLDLAWSDKPFGAEQFYGNFNSWERTKTWFASMRQDLGERTEAAFSYRRHTDLFVLYRDRPQVFTNRHAAESWHGSVRRRESLAQNVTLHYGGEGFGENIDSTNLGRHDRARGAAYTMLDVRVLRRFSFSTGLRSEVLKGLPGELNPTAAVGYWASSKLKFRGAVSRAFRLPTFTDLYYQDPGNRGSPDLRPERSWSYEGGADYRPVSNLRLQATIFHRRDNDGIDYARTSPADIWRARNIQSLRFTGLETSASLRVRGGSVVDVAYTGLKGSSEPLPGLQSKYAFNYPVHHFVAGYTGLLPGRVALRTRVGALERLNRGSYATWDLSATRAVGRFRPFIQFTNLTNTRYQEIIGVVMQARTLVGGTEFVWPRP
ncbi:MAG TPA: TonB-dependent receptor [Bryobacteraceae bacterium]|nr:TonB-dependent receptor [Bryobacteraceae bacterium]